jgi:hypothetical protein
MLLWVKILDCLYNDLARCNRMVQTVRHTSFRFRAAVQNSACFCGTFLAWNIPNKFMNDTSHYAIIG